MSEYPEPPPKLTCPVHGTRWTSNDGMTCYCGRSLSCALASLPPRGRRKDGAMKCNEPYLTPELVRANTSQAVTVLWCGLPDGHDGVHGDPVPAPHMPSQMKSNS